MPKSGSLRSLRMISKSSSAAKAREGGSSLSTFILRRGLSPNLDFPSFLLVHRP
ncbi:Uncharacterised protein [Vibrio cholerae]|nr:Uncharacterised protein [Vibrio cholerae]